MKKNKRKAMAQAASAPPVDRRKAIGAILLIVCLGAALYANALPGSFILDDGLLVQGNVTIRDWRNIPKMFTRDVGEGGGGDYGFWRPLQLLTYMVDHVFWKDNPVGYHLTNALLHILAAVALFWLLELLFKDTLLALLTALFFVAHPVHTEAVTYIAGRPDPMAALFMLLTLAFTVKAAETRRPWLFWAAVVSYTAALLSRENALIVPVLLGLIAVALGKRLPRPHVAAVTALAGAYIVLRLTLLRFLFEGHKASTAFLQRIPGFFVAFAAYLRILVLPFGLHMEYGEKTFPFFSPPVFLGILLFGAAVVFLLRERRKRGLVLFAISWFLLTLAPVSNVFFPINAYMAEHWLYLPSIGFFLLLAGGFSYLLRRAGTRAAALTGCCLLTVFWGTLTVAQNTTWADLQRFYERTIRYAPDSSRAYGNLAMLYQANGDTAKAERLYKKAMDLDAKNFKAAYNLGILYADAGRNAEAEQMYERSLEVKPNYANALNNLAKLYAETGRNDEAIALASRAVGFKEDHVQAYNNMTIAYIQQGKIPEAMEAIRNVLAFDPENEKALNNLGAAYLALKQYDNAVDAYQKLVALDPKYPEAWHNLGLAYASLGRLPDAIASYKKAIALRPGYTRAYYNLGVACEAAGDREGAVFGYSKALELRSDYLDAYNALKRLEAQGDK
ncbi:MAG: tetratricopeptide repeat protein [Deltaproteobacteria bacterium]